MPVLSPNIIENVERPELFFGLVGAVGAPLKWVSQHLTTELQKNGYNCNVIKLSDFLSEIKLGKPNPVPSPLSYIHKEQSAAVAVTKIIKKM